MLPKILDIAEQNGLTFNPKTYGKKETLCKCPFCEEDSRPGKGSRFYLSLNTNDQVYKCWYCNVSGGVLDFESRLTGKPYNEIREKYFGGRRKPIHPAERLNPNQLHLIGWKDYRRKDQRSFKQKREKVLQDWKVYEYTQLVELFAEFMVIAHIDNQEKRQTKLLTYLMKRSKETHIYLCFSKLLEEYAKEDHLRADWAKEGVVIARMAWKISYKENDFNLDGIVLQIPFLHYLYMKNKGMHRQQRNPNVINN